MAQAIHAAVELALAAPDRMSKTPNVVVLQVPDEDALMGWWMTVRRSEAPRQIFFEPDLGGAATALATFSTGEEFSSLPLAGREVTMSP